MAESEGERERIRIIEAAKRRQRQRLLLVTTIVECEKESEIESKMLKFGSVGFLVKNEFACVEIAHWASVLHVCGGD